MIASCPAEATEDEHRLCRTLNEEDPILSMIPITITSADNSSVVFRNIYCVRCSNVEPVHYKLWDAKFRCDNTSARIVDGVKTDNMAHWDSVKRKWMYAEEGKIAECDMIFAKDYEDKVKYHYRSCEPVVDTCPSGLWSSSVANLCKSYTAMLRSGFSTYKNPYCLMCNGGDPAEACKKKTVGFGIAKEQPPVVARFPASTGPPSISEAGGASRDSDVPMSTPLSVERVFNFFERGIDTLFKVNDDHLQCFQSKTFDPSLNACRRLLIRSPGYELKARIDTCNATIIDKDLFFLSEDNQTVTVPKYDRVYKKGMFRLTRSGKLLLCEDDVPRQPPRSTYALVVGVITVLGLSLSIVFLVAHLCAVALVSELRNLSGMNLASLCLALLGAYISFIAGNILRTSAPTAQNWCYPVAIFTYYFFMAAFFWMFVMAFDVCRVLRASARYLQTTSGLNWRRFSAYSAAAWGCPIILAVTAHLIDTSRPGCIDERFRPKFGSQNCWFGSLESLMVFFVIPLGVVMTLNISFFVYAAIVTSEDLSGHRKHLKICFKLTVMLGLTWVMGLLASVLNNHILWVVFSILNTLQGLFIFISFTLTSKVANGVSERLGWCRSCRKSKLQPPTMKGASSNMTINMILNSSTSSKEEQAIPEKVTQAKT